MRMLCRNNLERNISMINKEDIQMYGEVKSGEMFTYEDILSYIRLREYSMLTIGTMGRVTGIVRSMDKIVEEFWGITDTDIHVLKEEYTKKVVNEILRVYIEQEFDKNGFDSLEDEVNLNTYIGDYLDFCLVFQRKFGQRVNNERRSGIIEYEITNLKRIVTEEASRIEVNLFRVNKNLKYVNKILGDFIPTTK